MKLNHFPRAFYEKSQHGYFEDFDWLISPHLWTSLLADVGTSLTQNDAANGTVTIATAATDNNEVAIRTTKEIFLFAAGKPFVIESRFKFTTASTANVAFGFADAFGADLLVDNGGGPKTSYSGCLIYTKEGGTVWRCHSSKSTTQTDTASLTTAGGSSFQVLRMEGRMVTSTELEITFFVDEQPLRDSNQKPIKHSVTVTSATEMNLGVYAKTGTTSDLSLETDYIGWAQKR